MGLHQKITDKNTAEPCDCPEDDDHGVESPLIDESLQRGLEQVASGETVQRDDLLEDPEDVWTDGSE